MSYPTPILIGVIIGSLAAGPAAHAETGRIDRCVGPDIRFEKRLSPAWESAASQLKNDLKSLDELDRCAVVTLLPAGAEMIVQVVLADGRSAVRRVRRAEDLVSTIEALLLLPPAAAYDSPPAPPPAIIGAYPSDPRTEDASYLRAVALARMGDVEGASELAREYLARYPNGLRRVEADRLTKQRRP